MINKEKKIELWIDIEKKRQFRNVTQKELMGKIGLTGTMYIQMKNGLAKLEHYINSYVALGFKVPEL